MTYTLRPTALNMKTDNVYSLPDQDSYQKYLLLNLKDYNYFIYLN